MDKAEPVGLDFFPAKILFAYQIDDGQEIGFAKAGDFFIILAENGDMEKRGEKRVLAALRRAGIVGVHVGDRIARRRAGD